MISWLLIILVWIWIVYKFCGDLRSYGGDSDCIELYSGNFSVVLVFIHLRHGHVVHVLEIMSLYSPGFCFVFVPRKCECKLVLKFTALKFTLQPSLYRRPLALRDHPLLCETVKGQARSFMTFKKSKS